ncbi:hypothetical protein CTAM01_15007, partial [Colletotrichum tamarilloi]
TNRTEETAAQSPDGRILGSTYLSGARNTRHSTVHYSSLSSAVPVKIPYGYSPTQLDQPRAFSMIDIRPPEFQQSFHDPPTQGPSTALNIREKLQVALHPEAIPMAHEVDGGGVGRIDRVPVVCFQDLSPPNHPRSHPPSAAPNGIAFCPGL